MNTEIIVILATLAVLEGLLSADNALVMAVMVRPLPASLQQKALTYVMWGAMILRLAGVLLASFIIKYWFLRAFGAAYLAYLVIAHFLKKGKDDGEGPKELTGSFWNVVISLNLVNLAFSVDSILAGVALLKPAMRDTATGFWIVVAGGIMGLILVRFASTFFLKLLDRFPALDDVAYVLIGWIALKLGIETVEQVSELYHLGISAHMPPAVFWTGMALIAGVGTFIATRKAARSEVQADADVRAITEQRNRAANDPLDGRIDGT
ncbi:tellurium resistance protein TerC [Deinococcus sp. KSM4-11]|uniref:TerC family protein n=1 Tax=Deinococcus sp. KSM4-11 TaxID=2568654 RepID=UPI0010A2BF98|nr:TerC family protein [Deinococcus sp. KSM4-11]THF86699.1 tellurium resistance protein TerC [Deinococcus sp. KSM4-11]